MDLNMVFCEICKTSKEITGYNRDDPVLSCGHIKQLTNEIKVPEIEEMLCYEATKRGISVEQVRSEYIKGLMNMFSEESVSTVGHCDICGTVTIIIDKNGICRCGGNLQDNPGCGMPITDKKVNC